MSNEKRDICIAFFTLLLYNKPNYSGENQQKRPLLNVHIHIAFYTKTKFGQQLAANQLAQPGAGSGFVSCRILAHGIETNT